MEGYRDRGESRVGTILLVGALVAGGLYVADRANWIDINLPHPEVDLGSDPAVVNAAVDQNSYQTEVDFDITCLKRVSVGVDVEGFKNGPLGDGVIKKKIFGDFLLCGDNNQVEANAVETVDPITKQVTRVDVVLSGTVPIQPRVDHNDPRNCIDGNIGDTMDEINQKMQEYNDKKAKGENPGCDDGFEVTQLMGSDGLADVKDTANSAAQIAMTLDANPKAIMAEADQILIDKVTEQLRGMQRYANAEVVVTVERPSDMEDLQARLDAANAQDFRMFKETSVGTDDDGPYFYAVANDGSHVTVHLGGYASIDVDQLVVGEPAPATPGAG